MAKYLLPILVAAVSIPSADPQIRSEIEPTAIVIETDADATVYLDDVRQGIVPDSGKWTIRDPKPGSHQLRIEGYRKQPFVRKIVVTAGKTIRVAAKLADLTADLEVFTAPGTTVALDGRAAGTADTSGHLLISGIQAEHYRLHLECPGSNFLNRRVELEPDIVNSITLPLERIEATGDASAIAPHFAIHRVVTAGDDSLTGLFFGKNGHVVAWGNHLVEWDPGTGRQLSNLLIGDHFFRVSPDLEWVAINHYYRDNSNHTALVKTAEAVRKYQEQGSTEYPTVLGFAPAFSPDSKTVVLVDHGSEEHPNCRAEFLDLESRKSRNTWTDSCPHEFAYSPDGRWAAAANSNVALWDVTANKKLWDRHVGDRIDALIFSGDSRWLAALTSDTIYTWYVASGKPGRIFQHPDAEKAQFKGAVFLPGNRYLVASCNPGTTLYVLDSATGHPAAELHHGNPSISASSIVSLSAGGEWLAATCGSAVTIWKVTP